MSEFEDPELRDRLGRISGEYPDANAAYAAVVADVGRARRRRALVVGTSTTAVLIVAFLLAVGLRGQGSQTRSFSPVDTPPRTLDAGPSTMSPATTTTSTSTSTSTTTTLTTTTSPPTNPATTTVTVAPDSTAPVLPPDTIPSASAAPATPTTTTPRTSPTTSTPRRGTTPGRGTATSTSTSTPDAAPAETPPPPASSVPVAEPPATEPPATVPPAGTEPATTQPVTTQPAATDPPAEYRTFSGVGGSITVRLQYGSLRVVDKTSADGFLFSPRDLSGQSVDVRFYSSSHGTKITVQLSGATMVPAVEERDFSSGGSGPPPTTG